VLLIARYCKTEYDRQEWKYTNEIAINKFKNYHSFRDLPSVTFKTYGERKFTKLTEHSRFSVTCIFLNMPHVRTKNKNKSTLLQCNRFQISQLFVWLLTSKVGDTFCSSFQKRIFQEKSLLGWQKWWFQNHWSDWTLWKNSWNSPAK
jgi:hypothetical protein